MKTTNFWKFAKMYLTNIFSRNFDPTKLLKFLIPKNWPTQNLKKFSNSCAHENLIEQYITFLYDSFIFLVQITKYEKLDSSNFDNSSDCWLFSHYFLQWFCSSYNRIGSMYHKWLLRSFQHLLQLTKISFDASSYIQLSTQRVRVCNRPLNSAKRI